MNQHYAIEISTAPATEPVTLAQERLHLRLTATGSPLSHPDDALVTNFIQAAREKVEADTGRALITQTVKQYLDRWPGDGVIYLMRSPMTTVTSIQYVDTAGDTQTWASGEYRVDAKSRPPRITPEYGESFPSLRGVSNSVIITFPAGYSASPTLVPESLIAAINLLVGTWYEHRESIEGGFSGSELVPVPMAYDALIRPHIIWDF